MQNWPIVKSTTMQRAELRYAAEVGEFIPMEQLLQQWIFAEKRSVYWVCSRLNVTDETVRRWIRVLKLDADSVAS